MRDLGYSPARIRKEAMKILNADKNYRQTVAKNTLEYKKAIKQLIEDITKRAYLEGDMLIAAAGRMAWVDDLSIWKSAGKSLKGKSFLSQLVGAMAEQTRGVMKNLTRTTAFSTQSGMESIKNLYQNELDKATIKICSGTFSQEKVMNDLIHELSQSGLRTVNFDTGRSMQLDTAAKLAVRTGCHQLSGKVHNQNMKDTGCNLMYVAEHEGARNVGTGIANHEEWQGKVYYVRPGKDYSEEASRVGQDQIRDIWEETGYSPDGAYVNDPRGLYGYNCRHTCYVWFEGISEKPEPIKKIEPITYKGKTYDRYAVTQKMRAMERGIRALKREKAALTSLGMDTKEISVKIKEHIFEYGKFCDAAKVPYSKYNLRYDGSSGDLTKTKAYQRYHTMVEDSVGDTKSIPIKEIVDNKNKDAKISSVSKSVQIPENCTYLLKRDTNFTDKNIDQEVLTVINDTLKKQTEKWGDFQYDEIKLGKFNEGDKSVFITNMEVLGYSKKHQLYLSKYYFENGSLKDMEDLCREHFKSGWWKSESLEDLVNHEIMHARINYHNSYAKAVRLYETLQMDQRVKGFCKYVDKFPDEFLNEMFVSLEKGVQVDEKYVKVYNEYVEEFLGE